MKVSSCLFLLTCLFGAQAFLYDRFHDVVWKKPILLDEVTGKLFIQDGNWLYRILTSGVWTGVDGRKHVVGGIRDITDCLNCIVIRDVGVENVRDWILDDRKIFCHEDLLKDLKLVGFTDGLITNGLMNHLLRPTVYEDLDLLRNYGDVRRGIWDDNKVFLTKDIFKHINKFIDVDDVIDNRKILTRTGIVDDIDTDILRKKMLNTVDVLDKPVDLVDKRVKVDVNKKVIQRDFTTLDRTTPLRTWNTIGINDLQNRPFLDDVNKVDLLHRLLLSGKKRFITRDDILDTDDTRRFF